MDRARQSRTGWRKAIMLLWREGVRWRSGAERQSSIQMKRAAAPPMAARAAEPAAAPWRWPMAAPCFSEVLDAEAELELEALVEPAAELPLELAAVLGPVLGLSVAIGAVDEMMPTSTEATDAAVMAVAAGMP